MSLSEDEATAAQWIDEDDLGGMLNSEEDEFAEDREKAVDEVESYTDALSDANNNGLLILGVHEKE
jgi:hypothetical protein